jgi:molybdate transport system substrate-binding protein
MRTHAILVSAIALLLCAACSTPALSGSAPAGVELTLFGAASLSGVLDAAKPAFERAHPGTTLTISADSSSALATQIEQGAPADVFLSADTSSPQRLIDGGFAAETLVVFAANELTVIVPVGNPASIASPADLAKAGIKVIAAGDEVPITAYATRLVGNLGRQTGDPAAFEAAYAANIVSKEANVKAVVAKIELGEGDAGIVYVTDAKASTRVEIVDVPDPANVTASYAGVVVKTSAHQAAAAAFLAWFAGPDGQTILAGSGFLPPAS